MNTSPVSISEQTDRESALSVMRTKAVRCIPIVNDTNEVVGFETRTDLFWDGSEDTCVVLMAGGLGMRLRPLTDSVPKPLLDISGKPMLEHIIERFTRQGFRRFFISVNYKSEMVRHHFGDGSQWDCEINYVEEDKPLGTGGALSLLPTDKISKNIIVMNGDLLTALNFHQLLSFHDSSGGSATMCVRDYSISVPYGVVKVEGGYFADIVEKPAHPYLVNAGIYVIGADALDYIPKAEFFNLPDLFSKLKVQGNKTAIFPLHEAWQDVGNLEEYEKAKFDIEGQP